MFLGGPPLVKMATGEESDDESLGGAEMHSRLRPVRLLRRRRVDAIRLGREIVARINWRKHGPARRDPRPSRGTTPTSSSASCPPT